MIKLHEHKAIDLPIAIRVIGEPTLPVDKSYSVNEIKNFPVLFLETLKDIAKLRSNRVANIWMANINFMDATMCGQAIICKNTAFVYERLCKQSQYDSALFNELLK